MDKTTKATILEALDMKAASIKRAANTNKAPRFQAVYEAEQADVTKAKAWINEQPLDK